MSEICNLTVIHRETVIQRERLIVEMYGGTITVCVNKNNSYTINIIQPISFFLRVVKAIFKRNIFSSCSSCCSCSSWQLCNSTNGQKIRQVGIKSPDYKNSLLNYLTYCTHCKCLQTVFLGTEHLLVPFQKKKKRFLMFFLSGHNMEIM